MNENNSNYMRLVAHEHGYKYFIGYTPNGKTIYNVTPENEYPNNNPPVAGYGSDEYICNIKGVPNLFK